MLFQCCYESDRNQTATQSHLKLSHSCDLSFPIEYTAGMMDNDDKSDRIVILDAGSQYGKVSFIYNLDWIWKSCI